MRFAAVNFTDLLIVECPYPVKVEPPFTTGSEFAGVVAESGHGFTKGERVFGSALIGAFAQRAAVPAASLSRVPESIPMQPGCRTAAGTKATTAPRQWPPPSAASGSGRSPIRIFENRTWHAGGLNTSGAVRISDHYSTSFAAPHLFGDRRQEFEHDLRAMLAKCSPGGTFWEWPGDTEVLLSVK